ncbi:GerAB/ArcD/ProY family transporter [Paenibacillus sepulcri]|uniref:Spore germination protein n=1 Tax=Paenibacillus sepulcri TaxID=359917 RepID=A0ABS7BZI7_9BACL|nr:spore germination protein [Paenibacillus sepulcri]
MNEKEWVSPSQIAMLLLAFTLGSSIVFIPGPVIAAAGNGAWLSVIISGAAGIPGLLSILYLHHIYPSKSSFQYLGDVFGKWMGTLFSLLILFVLILMISNITVGVGSFFSSTMMLETPTYVFNFLILMVCALTALAGIEVTARLFVLFLMMMLATIFVILFLDLGKYHPDNLLPQLAEGISPIMHGAIINHGFPYSEMFVFSALLFFIRPAKNESTGKFMFFAYFANMIIFLGVVLCASMIFGKAAGTRNFTLYEMARVIEITGVFERIEMIAGITLIAGSYIKSTIALLALSSGFAHIFKLKDSRTVILPVSLLMFFISMSMFSTEMESNTFWTLIWPAITTCATIPIVLAAVVTLIKNAFKGS